MAAIAADGRQAGEELCPQLKESPIVHGVGCYDLLSARLIEATGFSVLYISEYAVAGRAVHELLRLLGSDDLCSAGLFTYARALALQSAAAVSGSCHS